MNSPERMPAETHKPFTGYLWGTLAVLTCPCHLSILAAVLAGTTVMREIPLQSLNQVVTALESLAGATAQQSDPAWVAGRVNEVFTAHDDLDASLVGAEDTLMALAERFDLDDSATVELKRLLIGYATRVTVELDRGADRATRALLTLAPEFNRLAELTVAASQASELIGKTALVDLPLASYRVHGANYFARRETLAGLRNGSPDYFNSHRGDAYDNVEHVLAGAERFRWVLGGTRFWEVVDQVSCREGWLADFYSQREAVDVFVRTARATCAAVGEAAFVAAVCGRFRPTAAREIVDAAFDGRPSARVELLLRGLGWRRHWAQRHEVRRVVDGARWALRGGRTR